MGLTPHRQTPNRARELRERVWRIVEQQLGAGRLCDRCGCTLATYAELCVAQLDERCPGFNQVEAATARAEAAVQRAG